jgi:hypothetical protein
MKVLITLIIMKNKCCGKHPNWADSQKERNHSVELKEYSRYTETGAELQLLILPKNL